MQTDYAIQAATVYIRHDAPPIKDGAVVFAHGRVAACGPASTVLAGYDGPVQDLGETVVVPGLINAHLHLELSHVLGTTTRGKGFATWVLSLIANSLEKLSQKALDKAITQLAACGTVAVIDITTRNTARIADALEAAGIGGALAIEFFGFAGGKELQWPISIAELPAHARKRITAAGHALYSTHPDTLVAAKRWCTEQGRPFSLHLAEHPDETKQMLTGSGDFADLLRKKGVLPADWAPPGCRPVEYADRLGLLDQQTLAVHCVQLDDTDIATLAARGTTVCLCPRSNAYIDVGLAPWKKLAAAGVPLCLGTDGLSSNSDLNLWNEALDILEQPDSPGFCEVLRWMTSTPARLLGAESDYGTLEPGVVAGYSIVPDGAIRTAQAKGPEPF